MEQGAQWLVIAAMVLTGVLALWRGALAILRIKADDGKEDALDEWVIRLEKGEPVIQAIAAALGVSIESDDDPQVVKEKVELAQATGTAKAVRKQHEKTAKKAKKLVG
jgi:hypothetical protein